MAERCAGRNRPSLETASKGLSLKGLGAGFEVWIDWYQDRLDGKPFDWEIERQWVLLSKERLSQSPAEINAYLKGLRGGAFTKELRRVRAIFIGHGETGKTSLIRALNGEDVIEGKEPMTQGISIKDAALSTNRIEEEAGVFTSVTDYTDDDLTVHFWDFGGQVMAHATHQFFLRSQCLYVVVLAGRAERNPNEEAEYWLEHVRAFGDSAPVLLVGNKADVMPVNLDLTTLAQKFPNITGFHSLSCTQAKRTFKAEFELFRKKFEANLKALGQNVQRFTPEQFKVLKTIEQNAVQDDFLSERRFGEICKANGIATEGPGGRRSLLDIFDKLGIVMHFERLPFLTDYVLNPRWLTYGVYTIMYSEEAKAAKGRLSEAGLVSILKKANPSISDGRVLRYPADRCAIIANAMIAFRVAYRLGVGELGTDEFVIPALLAPEQPGHDFKRDGALAFRFDFDGFLPRHVVPALAVERFQDIAKVKGREIIWQNGVLLRPSRHDSEALVRADYHTRTIDILVKGTDATLYLGMLRDSILTTLETMPQLPFEEKVELRPDMRSTTVGPARLDSSIWMPYEIIQTAHRSGLPSIAGPDGIYEMDRVLAAMPVRSDLRQADVFLSYSINDGALIQSLADELEGRHIPVWYDRGLMAGLPWRDALRQRIETVKVVVVLWTENALRSKWVIAEAQLADQQNKLICLRDPKLDPKRVPMPFGANHQIVEFGKMPELLEVLALTGVKPRI
jgi:GTPase SAR1 family protein